MPVTLNRVLIVWLTTGLAVTSSAGVLAGGASLKVSPERYRGDRLLVKLRSKFAAAEVATALYGATDVRPFRRARGAAASPVDRWRVVRLAKGVSVRAALNRLSHDPRVERVEPDWQVAVTSVPNDPLLSSLWGLDNSGQTGGTSDADVDAPEAWAVTTGDASVLVAVIDTGVDYTHPDLAANVWTNPGEIPGNGIDDDGDGFVDDVHGYDFYNDDGDPMDDFGHGTHVSGTIAAVGNNGIGVAGVSWSSRILAVKFLGASGSGYISDAVAGVVYATDRGARIMSNSWGGGGYSQALRDAIAGADAAGALFVAAAGNAAGDNDTYTVYPAGYDVPNVIAVAATDDHDGLAYFSNYGATTVHLGAPGQSILSTVPVTGAACCSDASGYKLLSGTSMATPHVSGAAALVFAQYPQATHLQVKERLVWSGDPIPALAGRTLSGARLNAKSALVDDTTPPAPVTDLAVVHSGSHGVTLAWTATGDDVLAGRATGYDLRYSLAPIDDAGFGSAAGVGGVPRPDPTGTAQTFEIRGLEPQTTYYFALRVHDKVGNASDLSNVPTVTTEPAVELFRDAMQRRKNWTISGSNGVGGPALWHVSTHRFHGAPAAFYYGLESSLTYDTGARNRGALVSPIIDLRGHKGAWLTFQHFLQTENWSGLLFDRARVSVRKEDGDLTRVWRTLFATASGTAGQMAAKDLDLSAFDGHLISLRFDFDTGDSYFNHYEGWVVDDVVVTVDP